MSVLANTLNAYAGKIKAQRKAAEREAQLAARRKSAEQRLADKMRIEADRLLKQQHQRDGDWLYSSRTRLKHYCYW
jgi:hypothetical protein